MDDMTAEALEEKLANSASSAEDPTNAQPTEEIASAISDETAAIGQGGEEQAPGPIPLDRHQAILSKAREEAEQVRQEFEAYKQNLAWTSGLNQSQVQHSLDTVYQLQSDPLSFYRKLQREIEAHPHLGPQLKSPPEFKMPEPALRSQDGRAVWSSDQVQEILDYRTQQLEAKTAEQIGQIAAQLQQMREQEATRQAALAGRQSAEAAVNTLKQLPGWSDELEGKITRDFALIPPDRVQREGFKGILYELYLKHASPAQKKAAEQKVLSTLEQKAAAGTVKPSSGSAASASRPRNEFELEKWLRQQSGAAA